MLQTDSSQAMSYIMMCRPAAFGFNAQTAVDNYFQGNDNSSPDEVQKRALDEFDNYVKILKQHDIQVFVYEDTSEPAKPDAVFCNNWGTFHSDGTAIYYPMKTPNRRIERRKDLLDILQKEKGFQMKTFKDLSPAEEDGKYLEGSGSMNFDHLNKIIYASISQRTNEEIVKKVAEILGYETVVFHSVDKNGNDIYHVNVIMALGDKWAVLCEESIKNQDELKLVQDKLKATGKCIIPVSLDQIGKYAGNSYEATNPKGEKFFVISESGWDSLDDKQKEKIKSFATPLVIPLKTIEFYGGGSSRCMASDIRLPRN